MEQKIKVLPLLAEQLVADSSTHKTRKDIFMLSITDQVDLTECARTGPSAHTHLTLIVFRVQREIATPIWLCVICCATHQQFSASSCILHAT